MGVVSTRVIARNNFGRFIADVEGAATATVEEAIEKGVTMSKGMAPVGSRHDSRDIPIIDAFYTHMLGRTSGVWGNDSGHALFQELGTGPHLIIGSPFFRFFWESAGRWWIPGLFGDQDIINHPGNPPQPFMKPAYEVIARELLSIAAKHYPG